MKANPAAVARIFGERNTDDEPTPWDLAFTAATGHFTTGEPLADVRTLLAWFSDTVERELQRTKSGLEVGSGADLVLKCSRLRLDELVSRLGALLDSLRATVGEEPKEPRS